MNDLKNAKNDGYNFIVWVGDTPDYFKEYNDAINAYNEFLDDGYDDILLCNIDNEVIK